MPEQQSPSDEKVLPLNEAINNLIKKIHKNIPEDKKSDNQK